uniref:PI177L n=1 Tax=African swine fever virus TaxID=10497 RepID=A0A6G7KUJ7_ASF
MYEIILAIIIILLTIIIFYFYKTPFKCITTTKTPVLFIKFQLIAADSYQAITWKDGILNYEKIDQPTPLYLSVNGLIFDCAKLQPLTTKSNVTSGDKVIHIGQTFEYNNLLMWKVNDQGFLNISVTGTKLNLIAITGKLGFYADPPSHLIIMPLKFFPVHKFSKNEPNKKQKRFIYF